MRESTKTELKAAFNEFLEKMNRAIEADEAVQSADKSKFDEMSEVVESLQIAETVPDFRDAAEKAGLPTMSWILDRLSAAIDPNTCNLPINREVYNKVALLAEMRGCPIDTLGKGQLMTEWLTKAVDNGRI